MEGSEETVALQRTPTKEESEKSEKSEKFENYIIETIRSGNLETITKELTVKALTECNSDLLTMGIKVIYELRVLADKPVLEANKEEFSKLANSVEKLTIRLLDPLGRDAKKSKNFGEKMDTIMDEAIKLKQKKFFTHPVIHTELNRKWYGIYLSEVSWTSCKWLLINIWCIFEPLFFPISLFLFRRKAGYKDYLTTPHFVFVRDTLSYLALLGLNFAICLAPSRIAFSGLEWVVLVFFIGRLLEERRQIRDMEVRHIDDNPQGSKRQPASLRKLKFKRYLTDRWNRLDFISLLVYLITYLLRIVTWVVSESVTHNRALVIAGYLYGFNTMILTFRAVGQLMEITKKFGTIQIAFFKIIGDIIAIIVQFIAAIFAFSFAITKIYVAEKSFIADENNENQLACTATGISCWLMVFNHLAWSLLGNVEMDTLNSVDGSSVHVALVLYALFLIMGVILLVNMLIALLSNTYKRVEDNAFKEWSFKMAVAVQTYRDYHPIPVPLNIVSMPVMALWYLVYPYPKKDPPKMLGEIVPGLKNQYLIKYGYTLPRTDKEKLDQVVLETESIRLMVNQITKTTFTASNCDQLGPLPAGPQWHVSEGVHVEGCLLMCEGTKRCEKCGREPYGNHTYGARYIFPFSPAFPHFEVLIQDRVEMSWLGVGVVTKDYDIHKMPGWDQGTVGYHTDDGKIFDKSSYFGKETDSMVHRGDLIGCSVMFDEPHQEENQQQNKAKVVFRLNGSKITQDEILIDYKPGENLYPYIGLKKKGTTVLAKMRAEKTGAGSNALEELKSELVSLIRTEIHTEMARTKGSLDTILEKLREIQKDAGTRIR